MKKYFFQKKNPIFLKRVQNDCICWTDSNNIVREHPIPYRAYVHSVHKLKELNPMIYMFQESSQQI